jgi:acyl carrier protein
MGMLALFFGDNVYKFNSRLITVLLRIKGVRVGKNLLVLGKLRLKIRGKYSNIIIGDDVQFMGEVDLRNREQGKIIIGDRVKIDQGVRIIAANQATVRIGRESKVMLYACINAGADITIGNKSGVSAFCIVTSSSHRSEYGKNYMDQDYIHSPIAIGDGVQVGSHSTVLPGVEIGRDALISTHSVVVNDVSDNVHVGGIPARALGQRGVHAELSQTETQLSGTTKNTRDRFAEIFLVVFPSVVTLNEGELDALSRGDMAEWDSLNHLRLLAVIEQEFDIKISDEDALQFRSFSRVLNYLTNKI